MAKVMTVHESRENAATVCALSTLASKEKWKFYTGDTTCVCGRVENTTEHMLECFQLAYPCSLNDLITFNNVGIQCTEHWEIMV